MRKFLGKKSKIFLTITLVLISWEICFGLILGYFAGRFSSGKNTGQQGKVKSLTLNISHYKLHLHHWLLSSVALILTFFYNISFLPSQFSYAFLGGLIIQGIFCYSDWHRILTKLS